MSSPMELELELETVLSNPTPCDSSSAWIYGLQSIFDVSAAAYAVEWDNSDRVMQESDQRALAILGHGKDPFHVGNDRKRVDINVFHDHAGNDRKRVDINVFHDHAGQVSEPVLRESARQRGITLTGRIEP